MASGQKCDTLRKKPGFYFITYTQYSHACCHEILDVKMDGKQTAWTTTTTAATTHFLLLKVLLKLFQKVSSLVEYAAEM